MSEFITRIGGGEYQVIFKTNSNENYHAVEDFCREIIDHGKPSGWISVKNRMPETRHAVLVYTPYYKNIWAASMHEDGNWYIWSPGNRVLLGPDWYGPITHWMPLPEPPKEEGTC